MQFDLGDYLAFLASGSHLIVEVLKEAFDLGQRRPSHGPGQSMRNLVLEHRVAAAG